jgi:hypothetical protein
LFQLTKIFGKQKNPESFRAASPASSDCKIVSLAKIDSESWESSRKLERTLEEIERFCHQLAKKSNEGNCQIEYLEKN